eukprot:s8049_g1.t1
MDPLAHEFVPGAASYLMTEGHEDGPAAHGPPSKTKENWNSQEASSPMGKPHAENSTYNNVESLDELLGSAGANRL